MREVFLLDTAAAQGELVLPALKTYVEFPFPPLMADLDAPDLLRSPVAQETISGIRTTKYRIDHQAADGSRARGYPVGEPRRHADEARSRRDPRPWRQAARHRHGATHVEIGPQDPQLFALPEGFAQLPATRSGPCSAPSPPAEKKAGHPGRPASQLRVVPRRQARASCY